MKKLILKKFSALIVMMMFSIVTTNAQIVYTDVIPDKTVDTNEGVYHLDLNSDGINDFNITYDTTFISKTCGGTPRTGTNIYIRITPLDSNEVGNDNLYPVALLLNSQIDSGSCKWKNNVNQILEKREWYCGASRRGYFWSGRYYGNWYGAVNKFIPLRLDVSAQKYYGWVRLNIASEALSFTVKDYAYNSIPNQTILAGDTTTAPTGIIEKSYASSINLFPNPSNNYLTIAFVSNNKKVDVTITDITGKVIYNTIATDTQKIEVNTKDFAEGIYSVKVNSADFIETKKLVVEK